MAHFRDFLPSFGLVVSYSYKPNIFNAFKPNPNLKSDSDVNHKISSQLQFVQPIFTIIIIIYGIKYSCVHELTRETKYHLFEEKKEHVKNAARNSHPPESTVQNKRQWRTELQIHPQTQTKDVSLTSLTTGCARVQ